MRKFLWKLMFVLLQILIDFGPYIDSPEVELKGFWKN